MYIYGVISAFVIFIYTKNNNLHNKCVSQSYKNVFDYKLRKKPLGI